MFCSTIDCCVSRLTPSSDDAASNSVANFQLSSTPPKVALPTLAVRLHLAPTSIGKSNILCHIGPCGNALPSGITSMTMYPFFTRIEFTMSAVGLLV